MDDHHFNYIKNLNFFFLVVFKFEFFKVLNISILNLQTLGLLRAVSNSYNHGKDHIFDIVGDPHTLV